jgi:hypothetical protein
VLSRPFNRIANVDERLERLRHLRAACGLRPARLHGLEAGDVGAGHLARDLTVHKTLPETEVLPTVPVWTSVMVAGDVVWR